MPLRMYRNHNSSCSSEIIVDFIGTLAYVMGLTGLIIGCWQVLLIGIILWEIASLIAYPKNNIIDIVILVSYLTFYFGLSYVTIMYWFILRVALIALSAYNMICSAYNLVLEIRRR